MLSGASQLIAPSPFDNFLSEQNPILLRTISQLSDAELAQAKIVTDAWLRLSRMVRNHSIPYLQQLADLAREAAA